MCFYHEQYYDPIHLKSYQKVNYLPLGTIFKRFRLVNAKGKCKRRCC